MTVVLFAAFAAAAPADGAADEAVRLADDVRARCVEQLEAALASDQPWVRVHAGEALASLGRPGPVLEAFRPDADTARPQYRVGVWRVLALAERPDRRGEYVGRIRRAFLDPGGEDRIHAVEALAKLDAPQDADGAERRAARAFADEGKSGAPFAIWRLAQAGDTTAAARLAPLLNDPDETTRLRAAYVLGRLLPASASTTESLTQALARERPGSITHSVMRASLGAEAAREMLGDPDAPQYARYSAAMRLAELGTPGDRAALARLLDDPDQDVRVAASFAVLRLDARPAAAATAPTRPARGDGKADGQARTR